MRYDIVIRNGIICDGSGSAPSAGDVAIQGDRIAAVAEKIADGGRAELDAAGRVVAPGFINMLSWANVSLIVDGRSQSDIRQGVTLEVLGEGTSMGPLTQAMRREMSDRQGDLRYAVEWTTLGEYLDHLVARGVSCNVASFMGATTARVNVLGYENRRPT
ncbi:MAG: D-aminoacylase, partial [bacterium]